MKVLAIDSAFDHIAVSLEWEEGLVERSIQAGLKHSERLMPMIDAILAEAGLGPSELGLVACMEGPGSFTGLRIAMATAKGIAFGTGCPMAAVPSLDCLAYGREYFPGIVLPLIDAKRDRFYAALYSGGELLGDYLDIGREELFESLAGKAAVLLTGPGAPLAEPWLGRREGMAIDPLHGASRCRAISALGRKALAEGRAAGPEAAPLYLRKSDAEEALDRRP